MKRWLLAGLLASTSAFAQNATVTANVKTLAGAGAQPSGSSIRVDLQNCATPRVPGTGNIISKSQTFYPNGSGVVTITLFSNSVLDCGAGVLQNPVSFYTFNLTSNGGVTSLGSYKVPVGTSTLDTLTPLNQTPVVNTPSGDTTYLRLDLSNFSNLVQPVSFWNVSGALSAGSLSTSGSATVGGNLSVTGSITGLLNLSLTGNISAFKSTEQTYVSTGCPVVTDATHICITDAPYNASNAGLTTTTTTATFAPGASGQVASCSTFSANQGVLITGAGASGVNYVGKILSCTGTTLTVSPNTSTSVAGGTVVQHDESAAFQAAVTAGATNGITAYIPDGWYLINGPLQDPAHAAAVIDLPNLNYGAAATPAPVIRFSGFTRPSTETGAGAIIFSSIPSGNVFGAYNPGSPAQFVGFTNYFLDFENVTFRAPHNPGMVMMNLTNAVASRIDHVRCDTGTNGDSPLPTNTNSGCLYLPSFGNNVTLRVTDLAVSGFANALWAYEHSDITGLIEANDINGLIPDSGPIGTLDGPNSIRVGYFWCQQCTNQLSAGLNPQTVSISNMDIESVRAFGINDPSNLLRGQVDYQVNAFNGADTPFNPSVNGATNLCLKNLKNPGYNFNCFPFAGIPTISLGSASGTGGSVAVTLASGSNDGAGSIILVTGASGTTSNGIMATLTLDIGRRKFPAIVLQPANLAASGLAAWTNDTSAQTITINSGSVAPTANTTYTWTYSIPGGLN